MQQGNYHCSVKSVSRSQGRSATAAAAYRAGAEIADERTGEVHDYTRKQGVIHAEIVAPEGVSVDRESLWNQAEAAEKRKDAKVAREWELALPHELDRKEQIALAKEFAGKLVERYGVAVDVCIHEPHREGDQRNTHAHLLTTTRQITPEGLTAKTRELDSPKTSGAELDAMRGAWADCCNRAYERAGLNIRTDHRTLKAQGIDREATTHLGPTATQMERRGAESDRGNINREIYDKAAEIERLQSALQEVTKELAEISKEIDKPEPEKKPISASAFLKQKEEAKQEPQKAPEITELEAFKITAQNKDLSEVRNLVNKLRAATQKKDLETEARNTPEHKELSAKISGLQQTAGNTERTAANFARMKDEVKGFFKGKEKAEYARLEEEEKKKHLAATSQLAEEKSKLSALEHALTRPGSDLEKSVKAHNERADKAADILREIAPIYQQRQAEQIRQEREQKQSKERGGHER